MMRHLLLLIMTASLALGIMAQTNRIFIEGFEIEPGTIDSVQVMYFIY